MKRSPNSVDVYVGSRVRSRRMAVGLTQEKLARALGLSFQQIQKYEKGSNRIGAGRLQAISRILEAPVSFFYADAPAALSARLNEAREATIGGAHPTPAETLDLLKAFRNIEDPEARRNLIGLAMALGAKPAKAGEN